jgi:hypothetical protein
LALASAVNPLAVEVVFVVVLSMEEEEVGRKDEWVILCWYSVDQAYKTLLALLLVAEGAR